MTQDEFNGSTRMPEGFRPFLTIFSHRFPFYRMNDEVADKVWVKFRDFTYEDACAGVTRYDEENPDANGRTFKIMEVVRCCNEIVGRDSTIFTWSAWDESDWTNFIEHLRAINWPYPVKADQFAREVLDKPRGPTPYEQMVAVKLLKEMGARHIDDIRGHRGESRGAAPRIIVESEDEELKGVQSIGQMVATTSYAARAERALRNVPEHVKRRLPKQVGKRGDEKDDQ